MDQDSSGLHQEMKNDFQAVLDELDAEGTLDSRPAACFSFMVSIARSLTLSEVALAALEVGTRYRKHQASEAELEQARVACWEAISGRENDVNDATIATMRAVICLLFPLEDLPLAYDQLHLFGMLSMNAGIPSLQLGSSLLGFFREVS